MIYHDDLHARLKIQSGGFIARLKSSVFSTPWIKGEEDKMLEDGEIGRVRDIKTAVLKAIEEEVSKAIVESRLSDTGKWKCEYTLEKREGDIDACKTIKERAAFLKDVVPYEILRGKDNCLLNSGINEMWDLITGVVSGASHIYDNAAAQIGVGDSSTAADATQTDLQAAVNKTYKGMEATYPTSTVQKITCKSSFGSSDANYVWAEWVIKHGTSAICINRKVDAMGTKASGSTWTLEVTITLS